MLTQSLRRTTMVALLMLSPLALPAFAAGPVSRIASINGTGTSAIRGSAHPMARPEFDRGVVPDATPLSGLSINFQRSASQQSALESLIAAQSDPGSPQFHQWLTPEQFAANYGMSLDDIAKVTAWLTSQGFSILKVADSSNAIFFSGTAGQVHNAFGTEIHHYAVNGVTHYANASEVTLPAGLAAVVSGVNGLDDFKPSPHYVRLPVASASISANFTSGISGNHYLTPGDFSTIYDVKPLTNGGFTGAGVMIGVAGQTDIVLSDITAFRAAAGLPVNNPTVVLAPNDPNIISYGNDLPEADLDLEWSGGIAPNANIVFLNSPDAFTSLIYGIKNRVTVNSNSVLLPIISISYGLCELGAQQLQAPTSLTNMESALQQAASQGQTVIVAAGDNGAADCDTGSISTQGLAVDYPGSSAYVTDIGGTTFNDGSGLGGTTYWSANGSTDVISSALSYIPEMVWNDTPTAAIASIDGTLLGGGGGKSILFTKPTWQTGVPGIPQDGQRDVPDISLSASVAHDPYLVCTQVQLASNPTGPFVGSCGNGFRIADGTAVDNQDLTAFGGTSLGAPSFAGVLALIEQKLGSQQGLINKALYSIASNATTYASAFHDITLGNNAMPCSGGNGCVNGVVGYNAGTGYDQATGLGSIDANNLATAYAAYVATNGGKVGTSATLTYLPTSLVIGQSETFTVHVTANSGGGTPSGTVTFSVDGVATGGAVTLVAGAASTSYSFASGGTHTVVASYSGDNTDYASLSPTLTLTGFADAGGAALTTTVLTSNANTTALYSAVSPVYTATVTSATAGTLGGTTVTFTVGTGTGAVSTKSTSSNCSTTQCIFTLAATNVTDATGYSAGSVTVSAHYDGNTSYQQSSSNTLSITVSNPAFTIAVPTMTVSSSALAAPATATATITSSGGFADTINLVLTTTNYPGCGFIAPSAVTPAANGTATATITLESCSLATSTGVANLRGGVAANGFGAGNTRMAQALGVLLALLCVAGCFRRRGLSRVTMMAVIVLLGGLMAGITGCGNSGGSVVGSNLPAGTYQVTLTGTDAVNTLIPPVSTTFNVVVH